MRCPPRILRPRAAWRASRAGRDDLPQRERDRRRRALAVQWGWTGVNQPAKLPCDLRGLARLQQHVQDAGVAKPVGIVEVLGMAGDGEDRNRPRVGGLLQRPAELEPSIPGTARSVTTASGCCSRAFSSAW